MPLWNYHHNQNNNCTLTFPKVFSYVFEIPPSHYSLCPIIPEQPLFDLRDRYIICKTQCKMKIWDPLFEKQRKFYFNGTKLQSFFFSSVISLIASHGVFHLLFNGFLNKEKIKFKIISMNFATYLYVIQSQF